METDSWIERTIIQELSFHDERYKHDYGGREGSTETLIADCAHLKDLTSDGPMLMFENLAQQHAEIEDDVEEAAQRLHRKGLLSKVREEPVQDQLSGDVIGQTTVWEPTEEGLAEAKRLNEAYSEAVADLLEEHDDPETISVDDVRPILREYGVILEQFSKEFFEMEEDE